MTWYTYQNYGTALQAAALSYEIERLGYEPSMIRYAPKKAVLADPPDLRFFWQKFLQVLQGQRYRPYSSARKTELFSNFLKSSMRETEPCASYPELHELNTKFDAFVCGSDQIWAPSCFDDKYYLPFVDDANKMVAYAPSVGQPSIANDAVKERMKSLISRFDHLSVRESQGAALIASLCGKKAEVVLDPTLLLNEEEWKALLGFSESGAGRTSGGYILCYFLGEYRRYRRAVRRISKALQMPVYVIPVFQEQEGRRDAVPFEVGPVEFVRLVKNAAYVCTDSFHGTAFAMNFNIPFTVFKRFRDRDPKNQNSRINSLLELTGLRQRLADGKRMNTTNLQCDFTQANRVIGDERKKSLDYLRGALKSASGMKPKGTTDFGEYRIAELCCGCGACAAVCPENAVSIRTNEEGFAHYAVDAKLCVRCGRCRKVCPYCRISAALLMNAKKMYSFQSNHSAALKVSSSGGAAYEIADLLNRGGFWVCGSVYNRYGDCAEHLLISPNHPKELSVFQGSKYLQSESAESLFRIASLPEGEKIVFFGTPCQTAGLDKILRLKGRRDDALLVDLICHGVPTRLLWEKYLCSLEKRYGIPKHPEVRFRSAKGGWRNRTMEISGSGHSYLKNEKKDAFYAFFRHTLCDMRACYECPYRERSAADLRVGDYWGPRFTHNRSGVSMVIAVTSHGEEIVNRLAKENHGTVAEKPMEEYWSVQFPQNPPFPLFYDSLLSELKENGRPLEKIRKHYAKPFEWYEMFCKIARILKNKIKG